MVDLETFIVEMMLDLRLTNEQRREYGQLWMDDWKKWDQGKRQKIVKNLEFQADVPTWSNYIRNIKRVFNLPKNLERAGKSTDATDRWLVATYTAMTKPGSERNPVLVEGKPLLTQLEVDRYPDYVEVMLDLAISGGFTAAQRQVFQDYLVKDWKKMTSDEREELLGDIRRWLAAAGEGARGNEAVKIIKALRPKLLARLQADKRESSKWLLEILTQERTKEARLTQAQRRYFEAAQFIIR